LNRQSSKFEAAPTTLASVSISAPKSIENNQEEKNKGQTVENEPKVIEKRQSGPDRYASNFGNNGPRNNRDGGDNDRDFEFQDQGPQRQPQEGGEFGLPRGYIGNNGGRVGDGGRVDGEFEGPQYQPASGDRDRDEGSGRQGGSHRGGGDDNYGFSENNDRDYGFGPDSTGGDFNFGPPTDFGRESSSPSSGSGNRDRDSGFRFDFSIPKEYDPDVQVAGGGSNNNNNGPSLDGDGSASSSPESRNFDIGYDDYVKRHFPESFGPPSSSSPSESSSVRPSSSSFQPSGMCSTYFYLCLYV
jgi:hypothetical protein